MVGVLQGEAAMGPSRLRKKRMTTALLFSTWCARGRSAERSDAHGPSRGADCGPRRGRTGRLEAIANCSRVLGREVADPDHVVGGEGKRKQPGHDEGAPEERLWDYVD